MTPRENPVPRAREALRWLSGIAFLGLLAAGVVAAAVLLWQAVDIDELLQAAEEPASVPAALRVDGPGLPPARPATGAAGPPVAVLVSEDSRGHFPTPDVYGGALEHWRDVAAATVGEPATVRSAEEVEALPAGATVVVPVAPCLPFATGMALYRHLRDGGSLVLEGPVATRDEACAWTGWSVLRSLTGAERVAEVEPRESLYLTIPGGLPFAHGLVPGSRVELGHDLQIAVEVEGPGGYWSDWGLSPAPAAGTEEAVTGAVARPVRGGGRMAWFGFLASQAARDDDRDRVRRLHESALLWAARRPLASLAAWPDAKRAALLVTEDVEAEARNARVLADFLRRRELPGTFFVVSRQVEDHPEMARELAAAGEVGTHTHDHRTLRGRPLEDQLVRLRRSRSSAAGWSGAAVAGLRPPEELFDRNTLAAWSRAGGSYVAAENAGRSASPELHPVEGSGEAMVLLPRVMKDDYNLLVNDGLSWEEALPSLLDSFRKVHRLGGLALLNLHTQFVDLGRADDVAGVMDSLRARGGWWPATAGTAASWWRARHRASVEIAGGGDELRIGVAAPPDTSLHGATVRVTPPGEPGAWEPAPGQPGIRFARTGFGLDVVVDSLPAGDTARVVIRRRSGPGPP